MTTSTIMLTPSDVAGAARRVAPYVRRTPVLRAEVDGRPVVLKLEHLQRTGSFKLRGALNAMLGGDGPEHVVTASGGNHGLAVATAARLLDRPATVFVPATAPEGKARRIAATGVRLVRHGTLYAEARDAALAEAVAIGGLCLPAYDDPLVVAGAGTCAAELVEQVPEVDALVVGVGGGGLAAGTVLGSAGRPVVAVEPVDCACLHHALAAGRPVDSMVDSVAASALGATRVGDVPFTVLRDGAVRSVLVSDERIIAARDRLWEEFRLAVEPAAAASFAAFLAGEVPGELPGLILSGSNTDWSPE
ncbi:MAG TPA: serine/threonine dehydratase [Actinophytocola sp.]|uniref:serine/threonine dehydratase n=1 Tax=Actinophytocola sp. TaxID=1872138 RepID=UPI002DB85CAF|nr:serine/threonine dehydratase [Actinophytocola sp.]HEU5470140.1 serine/threonine dehydratase [Actinophytocola sp.]